MQDASTCICCIEQNPPVRRPVTRPQSRWKVWKSEEEGGRVSNVVSIMCPLVRIDRVNWFAKIWGSLSPLWSDAQSFGQSNSMYYIHIVHSPVLLSYGPCHTHWSACLAVNTITHNYIYHIIYNASAKGYLHFTVLLWKVTLWFASSCFSVDTPVYRIQYPEDKKPMLPFSWFKRPHVAVIKSVVFWSSSSTHVVILRRWQKAWNIFVTETFVIVVGNLYLSK